MTARACPAAIDVAAGAALAIEAVGFLGMGAHGLGRNPRRYGPLAESVRHAGFQCLSADAAAWSKSAVATTPYEETSVSDFVLANAVAAAQRVIGSHEKITLSAKDWEVFYDALINPPEPNEKLKEAARRYRERVGG